jgi:hypothetical protein
MTAKRRGENHRYAWTFYNSLTIFPRPPHQSFTRTESNQVKASDRATTTWRLRGWRQRKQRRSLGKDQQ